MLTCDPVVGDSAGQCDCTYRIQYLDHIEHIAWHEDLEV